jgi:hypothetical protein
MLNKVGLTDDSYITQSIQVALERRRDQKYGVVRANRKTAVLEKYMECKPFSFTPEVAELFEFKKRSLYTIYDLAKYGIPCRW